MQYFIDKKELECFYYNAISNTNFGLIVTEIDGLHDAFENDIEFIEVPGRNGELIVDNQRVKSRDLKISGYIDKELTNFSMSDIYKGMNKWLKSEMKYHKLEFVNEDLGFNALCYKFKMNETIKDLAKVEITFRVQGEDI